MISIFEYFKKFMKYIVFVVFIPIFIAFIVGMWDVEIGRFQNSFSKRFNDDYHYYRDGAMILEEIYERRSEYVDTKILKNDFEEGVDLLERAYQGKVWGAAYKLALIYSQGIPGFMEPSKIRCKTWMEKSKGHFYFAASTDRC